MSGQAASSSEWVAAERSLGDAEAVDQKASKLPPRQGLMLSALQALHDGDPERISQLAKQAKAMKALDVAAVLDITLEDRDRIRATAIRQRLKNAGVGSRTECPVLDVLRGFAEWRTGGKITLSRRVQHARTTRPLLDLAVEVLRRKNSGIDVTVAARNDWPRAVELALVAAHRPHGVDFASAEAERILGQRRLEWCEEEWPDLRKQQVSSLEDEILSPSTLPTTAVEWEIQQRIQEGSESLMRLAGLVLSRIMRELVEGRSVAAIAWCATALELVSQLSCDPSLLRDTLILQAKLSRLGGDAKLANMLLADLWKRSVAFPDRARTAIARDIVEAHASHPGSRSVVRTAMLWLLKADPDHARRNAMLTRNADLFDSASIRRAVSGASPADLADLLGVHACATENWELALKSARDLLLLENSATTGKAGGILDTVFCEIRRIPRPCQKPLAEILEILKKSGELPCSASTLLRIRHAAKSDPRLREGLCAGVDPWLEKISEDGVEAVETLLLSALLGGRESLAKRVFGGLGRRLQRDPDEPSSIGDAMRTLALLVAFRDDSAVRASAAGWIRSLSAHSLRDGADSFCDDLAAVQLDSFHRRALRLWIGSQRKRFQDTDWEEALLPPDERRSRVPGSFGFDFEDFDFSDLDFGAFGGGSDSDRPPRPF